MEADEEVLNDGLLTPESLAQVFSVSHTSMRGPTGQPIALMAASVAHFTTTSVFPVPGPPVTWSKRSVGSVLASTTCRPAFTASIASCCSEDHVRSGMDVMRRAVQVSAERSHPKLTGLRNSRSVHAEPESVHPVPVDPA